ncbi:hypothetical protein [Aeromonas sp. 603404]|uniref:hypothetical protein n=1 Tax=Aeromonas sp. 603404 TaxID=2712047 RepID=UPI003B9F84C8
MAKHREASTYYSIIHKYPMALADTQHILADKTRHIQPPPTAIATGISCSPTWTNCH